MAFDTAAAITTARITSIKTAGSFGSAVNPSGTPKSYRFDPYGYGTLKIDGTPTTTTKCEFTFDSTNVKSYVIALGDAANSKYDTVHIYKSGELWVVGQNAISNTEANVD